MKMNGLVTL